MAYRGSKRTWSQSRGGRGGNRGDAPAKRPRFSGFLATEDQPDPNETVEVGLLVRIHWVGMLIGKKGATIKELTKASDAKMMFGKDDVLADQEKYHVMAISGSRDQIKKACIAIAEKLGEITQSEDYKLVFLIPDTFCGMFIGKKGANVKKMKAEGGDKVWIKLSQEPVKLPGVTEATTCTVYGPKEDVKKTIGIVTDTLGDISSNMKQAAEPEQPPPSYGGGFGGGRGGSSMYGGGFRDVREMDGPGGQPGYESRYRDVRGMDSRGGRGYGGGFSRGGEPYGRRGETFGRGGEPADYRRGGMRGEYGRGGGFSRGGYPTSPVGRGGMGRSRGWRSSGRF